MNFLNCLVANNEVTGIYDDQIIECPSSIKCELISAVNYTDIPVQDLKDESVDHTSGCASMNFLSSCMQVKEEIKDICDDSAAESLSSIKYEDVEIKSEENYSDTPLLNLKDEPFCCTSGCANVSFSRNCMDVKEEIQDIYDDSAIENLSSIKCEDAEIKSEQNHSGTPLPNLKGGPVDCSSGYQTENVKANNSTLKHKRKRDESKDKYHGLEYRVCSETRIFKCDRCDYETNRKCYLILHQLRHKVVPEDQMHKCGWCKYKTGRMSYLRRHERRHKETSEERMCKCDSCGYKTVYKNTFTKHLLIHKYPSDEQMHKCDKCNFKTIYKNSFIQHQIRHKVIPEEQMYKCGWCEYKTGVKSYLKVHELRHKNIPEDRMHKCDSCNYKTVYKSKLTRHQLRHKNTTEKQMYKCGLCKYYKTVYKRRFIQHQLKHNVPKTIN